MLDGFGSGMFYNNDKASLPERERAYALKASVVLSELVDGCKGIITLLLRSREFIARFL